MGFAFEVARGLPKRSGDFIQVIHHIIRAYGPVAIPTLGGHAVVELDRIVDAQWHHHGFRVLMEPLAGVTGADFRGERMRQIRIGIVAAVQGFDALAIDLGKQCRVLLPFFFAERRMEAVRKRQRLAVADGVSPVGRHFVQPADAPPSKSWTEKIAIG